MTDFEADPRFDEDGYLQLNPDIAHAVQTGSIPSGYYHYYHAGRSEGRKYVTPFDGRLISYRAHLASCYISSLDQSAEKITIVIQIRDESDYILEFISYYHLLGVDRFIIFDNGSLDNSLINMLKAKECLDVMILPWPSLQPHEPSQFASHKLISKLAYQGIIKGWLLFVDCDEFLVLHQHNSIRDFLADYIDCDALAFNWLIFGSNYHKSMTPGLVIERFIRRSEYSFGVNRHIKSLVRAEALLDEFSNVHYFHMRPGSRYVFPSRIDVPDYSKGFSNENLYWGNRGENYSIAQMNHYTVKSREEWIVKENRGRQGTDYARNITEHRRAHDRNEVLDRSIHKMIEQTRGLVNKLRCLKDG